MIAGMHRFHGHASLSQVYRHGQVVRGAQLSLKYSLNSRRRSYRAAVVVSRKVDTSAVVRNRIRRRVYEIVRLESGAITKPYDLVFTVFSNQLADLQPVKLQHLVHDQLYKAGAITSVADPNHAIVSGKETE